MKKKLNIDSSASINRLKVVTNRLVNSSFVGGYRSVFRGRGLEFADYRPYTPSDDASLIDWRASLKSNELLIKEFIEERNLHVFFLIDVSSSMIYGTIDRLKIEYAAELIATLSFAVIHSGDSLGFAMFSDKIIARELPKFGFSPYYHLMRSLVNPRHYGGGYDLGEALRFTMAFLKEYSVVIIISDFMGLKEEWKRELKIMGKKFDLIGIMLRDPVERELPDYHGRAVLGDMFSNKSVVVDIDKIRDDYKKHSEQKEKEIEHAFFEAGADFIAIMTDRPFIKPITDLFEKREKRHR